MTQDVRTQVAGFLRAHELAGSTLVVAVSGGPDSVCLLHVLAGLREEMGLTLHVAHLDHGLRAESEADARYVKSLATRLGLSCSVWRADVRACQMEHRMSLEEAAREVRYRFLAQVAQDVGTRFVVTGHTTSDNVETVLLHLVRGTGVRGLAGLRPLTDWTMGKVKITVARPLLGVSRAETEAYCEQYDLRPHLDATNLSLAPLRNRVRLKLLPLLRSYNPAVDNALQRLAVAAGSETEFLDLAARGLWSKVAKRQEGVVILHKARFCQLHPALQRHLLRQAIDGMRGSLKDIELRHIEDILGSLSLPAGRRLDLPYGLVFVVGYDRYWLGYPEAIPCPFPPLAGEYPLQVPGITTLPGWQVVAQFVQGLPPDNVHGLVAYADADRVGEGLAVRGWKRGDRFQPLGLGHEKKVGEFLIDEKVPRHWRPHIPIVVAPAQIVWVAGYRLDERAKVTPATKRVLRLEFERLT